MSKKVVRRKPDEIFVLEVKGVAVVAFAAQNRVEASGIRHEEWFQQDLGSLKSNGAPVWDGRTSFVARKATAQEIARYEEAARVAAPSDDLVLAFLIELDGVPSEEAPSANR